MSINVTTYQGTTVSVDTNRKVVTTKSFGDLPYTDLTTAVMEDKTPVYVLATSKGPVAIAFEDGKKLAAASCPAEVQAKVDADAAYYARYNKIANS